MTAGLALSGHVSAQQTFRLDEKGQWQAQEPARPLTADEKLIADARAALADGRPSRAESMLEDWIENNRTTGGPLFVQALLIRGDARVAGGDEYEALYDYEEIALDHVGTPEFTKAIERELEIALKYLGGLNRKFLGLRVTPATDIGEELLVRVQERLPGTPLAERACIELADHYYREQDLMAAADAYEIYVTNFPGGPNIDRARQRRIYASIARYKGPNYDTAGLVDAQALIQDFTARDPEAARRAGLGDDLVAKLEESMAAQLWNRHEWYLRRGDPVSARATLRRMVNLYPKTASAKRGLAELEKRGWTLVEPKAGAPAAEPSPEPASGEEPAGQPEAEPAPATEPTSAPAEPKR